MSDARRRSEHADKIKGSVKEAIGKLIGDGKVETEGKAQQKLPKRRRETEGPGPSA